MNELVGKMSPWYGLTQYSSHKLKIKSDQTGESEFQKVLNTEKIEISKEAKMFQKAKALIEEVGFVKFVMITRAINQIQRALTKTAQDYPAYKEDIESMMASFENQMPRSVSEAFSRLYDMLNDSKLPQEVIDTIMRYLEEEMQQASDGKVYDNEMNLIDMKAKHLATGTSQDMFFSNTPRLHYSRRWHPESS